MNQFIEGWIEDASGNKCSVGYWGTEAAAREALDSLKDCQDCINCSGCSDCSGCSGCSRCSRCSDCSRCSGCSRCSDCSGCSGCSRCSRCSDLNNAAPVEAGTTAASIKPVVPVVPDLHARIFAAVSEPGALDMSDWHTCKETHCRAGWVITLAGEEGRNLERFFDTALAAMKIYDASCPGYLINPARFFDSNDAALEDMRKLAEAE